MTHVDHAKRATEMCPLSEDLRDRIHALSELDNKPLRAVWHQAWGAPPPKGARQRFLMLGIAWRWQADHYGGLSPSLDRRLTALVRGAASDSAQPAPGTRLIREWKGIRHEVHVTERGYLFQGKSYSSLSSVARGITGAHRNGPAFFGLRTSKQSAS